MIKAIGPALRAAAAIQPDGVISVDRAALPAVAAGLALTAGGGMVVMPTLTAAEALVQEVQSLLKLSGAAATTHFLPEVESTRQESALLAVSERSRVLHVLTGGSGLVITSVAAAVVPVPAPAAYRRSCQKISRGDTIAPQKLVDMLIGLDYDNEVQVRIPGEFSWRGGIIDVFSPAQDTPVRLDFFGDEVDEIRTFSPDSQRSDGHLPSCLIVPRGDAVADVEPVNLWNWFPTDAKLLIWSPDACSGHLQRFADDSAAAAWIALQNGFSARTIQADERFGVEPSPVLIYGLEQLAGRILPLGDSEDDMTGGALRPIIERWRQDGYTVCFSSNNARRCERVAEIQLNPKLTVLPYGMTAGLIFPRERLVLLSEKELFGRATPAPRRNAHQYQADFLLHSGTDLCPGDLAVHAGYGICRFVGLQEQQFEGRRQEVMELEFAEDARLYVSLDRAYLISRYIGAGKKIPPLSRLDGGRWRKAREQAEQSAMDLAAELLRIQAIREAAAVGNSALAGHEQSLYHAFEAAFPFRETADQQQAIEAVRNDLSAARPMDRLLCGDVGFGKTEVAMRAACQVALAGGQVAVLAPTTVLVQQHAINFQRRFEDFPITVAALSRFQTAAEQKDVLKRLQQGAIDIVIGTHRLLSFDVHFHNLGLVVIDEEQRFGVRHKERLKQLRANVNVLTMTATPIPRTLHQAMAGLRALSTIMTPPESRLPVLTTVCEEDDDIVRHALERELQRDGQVYYLHNRVQRIEKAAARIATLAPGARIDIAHGQMSEDQLEAAMLRFINGETQILVCTTIIESGMDIPNANTIIMDRADRFGLSQLYQLRGRVGRDIHQAYALLLTPKRGVLEDAARERLTAIRKYTHLGSGFKLAIRDLELRGAGNLLGAEQSGHIEAVGLDMYCKLLRTAVDSLKNLHRRPAPEVPIMLDFLVLGKPDLPTQASASLPDSYIGEQDLRIECSRRLALFTSPQEIDSFAEELQDRFGTPPLEVRHLLAINRIRALACQRQIQSISVRGDRVLLHGPRGIIRGPGGRAPEIQPGGSAEQRLAQIFACVGRFA